METIKPLSDVDPRDLAIVERVFGKRIETIAGAVLILKTQDAPPSDGTTPGGEVPEWFNVLEGMSDDDLADFHSTLAEPVRLGRTPDGSQPS